MPVIVSSDASGGATIGTPTARRMSSAWVHVSKARTSTATRVAARLPHQSIGSSRRASPRAASSVSLAFAAASNSATARVGGRPACRARACAVRSSLSVAVSGCREPVHRAERPAATRWPTGGPRRRERSSRRTRWGRPGGPSRRRSGRATAGSPAHLDPVHVDRRGAGNHRGGLPAAACLGEHPTPQFGERRDVVDDRCRGSPAADRRPCSQRAMSGLASRWATMAAASSVSCASSA